MNDYQLVASIFIPLICGLLYIIIRLLKKEIDHGKNYKLVFFWIFEIFWMEYLILGMVKNAFAI
jgi:hypothetical protein